MEKLYKQRIVVEILTQDPDASRKDLFDILFRITNGDDSGVVTVGSLQEIAIADIVKEIVNQDSDPSFFYPIFEKLQIGDSVEVPEPQEGDSWHFEFSGTVIEIKGDNDEIATVEDQDSNFYDVEIVRLELGD